MTRPRIYVTRPIFPEAIELLETAGDTSVWPEERPPPYETLAAEAARSDALFTLLTDRIDEALLEASPRLRVVANMAVGYDNVDVAAATRRGVFVGNTPGVLTESTADFTMALLFALARRVSESERYVHEGRWRTWGPMALLGSDVHGATLGIVGMGRIGAAVARRARGFDMRVLYHSRTRKPGLERELRVAYAPLRQLLAEADFVTLHVPLTEATRRLIGGRELDAMRPTALLVNTARGEVVDQPALYRALEGGAIAGAALDVTDPEPIARDDPLLALDNVLVTPHIASASRATRLEMAMMAARNIVDVLEDRPPTHCVNPEAAQAQRHRREP